MVDRITCKLYIRLMAEEDKSSTKKRDRRLGDEWLDWDGKTIQESAESDYRVFLGLAVLSTIAVITAAGLFLWLIYPRLTGAGELLPKLFSVLFLIFAGILVAWLLLFVFAVVFRKPITRWIVIPQLVNKLLDIALAIGRLVGISRDRLTNSFLKIHNLFLGSHAVKTENEKLMVLLPRCLTRDNYKQLRAIRDKYGIQMATVGGGTEARKKIHELRPEVIIAIACERDLLTGFKDVNTHIPVIGFPNRRPEGPCKNTCVDIDEIEAAVRDRLRELETS